MSFKLRFTVAAALVLFSWSSLFWVASEAFAFTAPLLEQKSLSRRLDPVSAGGKDLPGFQGQRISKLRLVSFKNGEMIFIPYS